jgi:hypothetical protein
MGEVLGAKRVQHHLVNNKFPIQKLVTELGG